MVIRIDKIIFGGYGLGILPNGKKILIKKTVPGDIVEAEILYDKKDIAFGAVKKIVEASKFRTKPNCAHFYSCGGCDHQNILYADQLEYKELIIAENLTKNKIYTSIEKIMPASENHFFYRNSIRFIFSVDQNNRLVIARHSSNDKYHTTIIKKCWLQSEKSNKIIKTIIDTVNSNSIEKKLFWQLKIREGKKTGDSMIEIITSSHDLPGEKVLVKALQAIPNVRSIYHTIAPAKSLLNLKRRLIFGSPIIYEKIGKFKFQISPESFFQTNSEGVETLYDKIKEFADIKFGDEVIDLFCGTGSIGIYLSTLAKKVIGVESHPVAIRDANDNAKINKIKNIDFICTDANKINSRYLSNKVLILDPPRAGLKKELIKKISDSNFKKLIYVSCNPTTFARDLKYFQDKNIVATKIQPIDMFPQTHHIEIVSALTMIN